MMVNASGVSESATESVIGGSNVHAMERVMHVSGRCEGENGSQSESVIAKLIACHGAGERRRSGRCDEAI